MKAELREQLERIAASGIRLIPAPEVDSHFLFERDGFVVLVEQRAGRFGGIGSPGKLVEGFGFAALVRRGGQDWFVAKQRQWPAEAEQAEAARRLFTDLKAAIVNTSRPRTS